MGKERTSICISSSIGNWRDKLRVRTGLPEGRAGHTIFFGLYHWVDYLRVLTHWGRSTVFWCGGDILNLQKRVYWRNILRRKHIRHVCENKVEALALAYMGIEAEIHPMIFEEFVPTTFKPSLKPHVYLCAHPESEKEYGVYTITKIYKQCPDVTFHIYGIEGEDRGNVKFHGIVSSEQFNEDIKHYLAALRLNEFDGFSEVLAKSILSGGYPISKIPYPFIDTYDTEDELVALLNNLKTKTLPNPHQKYWEVTLNNSLEAVRA